MASEDQIKKPRRRRQRLLTLDSVPDERHASWLELFFDLVFVIAVAHVASILLAETNTVGLLKFTMLFFAIWWAWVGHTFYADRFESDEPEYRILTFAAMLAVASMAIRIEEAFTPEGSDSFALFYALALLILGANYARTAIYVPLARKLAFPYIVGLGGSASIFLLSLLVDPPAQFAIWAIGLALAIATPFLNAKIARIIPIDQSHIPERFGLFTIIVLGEAVMATANGAAGVPWSVLSGLTAGFGFAMAACIWWLNFEFVEHGVLKRPVLLPKDRIPLRTLLHRILDRRTWYRRRTCDQRIERSPSAHSNSLIVGRRCGDLSCGDYGYSARLRRLQPGIRSFRSDHA